MGEDAVEADESSIEELIGRRKKGEDGEEPSAVAHAPHFPSVRPLSLPLPLTVFTPRL